MTRQEATTSPNTMMGKVLIQNKEAYALFDPGSTHSFISCHFTSQAHLASEPLNYDIYVSTVMPRVLHSYICITFAYTYHYALLLIILFWIINYFPISKVLIKIL